MRLTAHLKAATECVAGLAIGGLFVLVVDHRLPAVGAVVAIVGRRPTLWLTLGSVMAAIPLSRLLILSIFERGQ